VLGIVGGDVKIKKANAITSIHNPFYTCIMTNMIPFGLLTSKKK